MDRRKLRKGKCWEEIYGNEKAKIMKENSSLIRKGHKHSEETKEKMRKSSKNYKIKGISYEEKYGVERAKEIKEKLKKHKRLSGENHHAWKGLNVSYNGIHIWVKNRKPKTKCEICGIEHKRMNLAFKDHSKPYTRNIEDYMWLCPKCHLIYDRGENWSPPKRPINLNKCIIEGCNNLFFAKDLCIKHYGFYLKHKLLPTEENRKIVKEQGIKKMIEKRKTNGTYNTSWNKGIPRSDETKKKISISNKGKVSPTKGKHIWENKEHPRGALNKHWKKKKKVIV